jgi:hypothetical protein
VVLVIAFAIDTVKFDESSHLKSPKKRVSKLWTSQWIVAAPTRRPFACLLRGQLRYRGMDDGVAGFFGGKF